MKSKQDLLDQLKQAGERLTMPRQAVIAALYELGGHQSTQSLQQYLAAKDIPLQEPTIYRVLQWLKDLALVSQADLGESGTAYELVTNPPHHHLICLVCGHVQDLDDAAFGPLRAYLRQQHDFEPRIDFVITTTAALPDALIPALEALHTRLWASDLGWAAKLEGSYIPQDALRRYDPDGGPYPQVNEQRFYMARHGSDWIIQRHILREGGVVIAGPPLHVLIDPVRPEDLRRAVRGLLREWWAPMLDNSTRIRSRDDYPPYAVLSMCRALYTLEHAQIVSKPQAARWAQTALDARWAPLIQQALDWRAGSPPVDADAALELVRLAVARAG